MKITITYGQQKYAPVQYHSFDVGPFLCEVDVDDGCNEAFKNAVCKKAYEFLRAQAAESFKVQLQEFLTRVKEAAAATRAK
jgi:hypothetical protein